VLGTVPNFPLSMSLTIGAYAGDMVMVSRNLKAWEEALQELDNRAQEIR
jgi:hypothetical protein